MAECVPRDSACPRYEKEDACPDAASTVKSAELEESEDDVPPPLRQLPEALVRVAAPSAETELPTPQANVQ